MLGHFIAIFRWNDEIRFQVNWTDIIEIIEKGATKYSP